MDEDSKEETHEGANDFTRITDFEGKNRIMHTMDLPVYAELVQKYWDACENVKGKEGDELIAAERNRRNRAGHLNCIAPIIRTEGLKPKWASL